SLDVFFFSSRRRHTRFSRDWSSDVCSSDLARERQLGRVGYRVAAPHALFRNPGQRADVEREAVAFAAVDTHRRLRTCPRAVEKQIGRASCRERVEIADVAGSGEKKARA